MEVLIADYGRINSHNKRDILKTAPSMNKKPPTELESLIVPAFCQAKNLECDNIRHHKLFIFDMMRVIFLVRHRQRCNLTLTINSKENSS
ncbi:hypothetical protein A6E14_00880 [Vibrio genomosp. F10]|uniref:Uncharacterized protein n=3 Tax=Vibrio genomosp. F10 TaxID=723171 RepID=A0A1B9R1Z6_9VIBR|nr:hypothetical protein A6E14_00880 [Vibrio genomosp. F10]OEE30919.1 hypothetical protein A1QO_14645 [Vibrio genomosp. F10 str. ZF-129]OEE94534.1 hypothetical protein A1QM_00690 [Vibrio genomosp. F10 str. 9ZC157]